MYVVNISFCFCGLSDNETTYDLVRVRRLEGNSCPDYAAVLPHGSAVVILLEKPMKFVYDSVHPVEITTDSEVVVGDSSSTEG